MSIPRYFRSVKSLATWKRGKEEKTVLDVHAEKYKSDLKDGRGYPSIWLPKDSEDLEKIALGILLGKGHLETISLVGFDESCFDKVGIELSEKADLAFPVPSVGHLHYEVTTSDEEILESVIQEFMKCSGGFEQISRADSKKNNMRQVAAKYIDEVAESYREKARDWGKDYLEN